MKIEAGKRYVRRDGKISGVISGWDDQSCLYPFWDREETLSYMPDGRYDSDGEPYPCDLIKEYIEPPSQEAVEIKVLRAEVAALKVECERLSEVLKLVVPTVMDVVKAIAAAQAVLVLKNIATQDELERAEQFALKCWQQRNN